MCSGLHVAAAAMPGTIQTQDCYLLMGHPQLIPAPCVCNVNDAAQCFATGQGLHSQCMVLQQVLHQYDAIKGTGHLSAEVAASGDMSCVDL